MPRDLNFGRTRRSGSEGDDGEVVVDIQINRSQKIFPPISLKFDVFKFPAIFAQPEIVVIVDSLVDVDDVDVDQLGDVADDVKGRLVADDDLTTDVFDLERLNTKGYNSYETMMGSTKVELMPCELFFVGLNPA